jgi:hypothetical protein
MIRKTTFSSKREKSAHNVWLRIIVPEISNDFSGTIAISALNMPYLAILSEKQPDFSGTISLTMYFVFVCTYGTYYSSA